MSATGEGSLGPPEVAAGNCEGKASGGSNGSLGGHADVPALPFLFIYIYFLLYYEVLGRGG